MSRIAAILLILSLSSVAGAEDAASNSGGVKTMSGMSVLGNNEAPKSLVIVPWKSSELGDGIDMGNLLDERANPVDKDVFMRELAYYEIRVAESATSTSLPDK